MRSSAAADGCCAFVAPTLVSLLQLERIARHRDRGDFHPLAWKGLQILLGLEIARWPTRAAEGNSPAHHSYGEGNVRWGEERVAAELSLKLGIWVSPRTVRKYWPKQSGDTGCRRTSSQPWRTFVKNHAQGIVACDFMVAVTARFRVLFVFVAMEVGSRRILHCNVTAHPTADWTLQQFREAIPGGHCYPFLIHDRDSIFSSELDEELKSSFGLRVLRTPARAPKANAYCERLVGTVDRECLDFMIPLNEPTCAEPCGPGWLTIIKDAHTPAWALGFRRNPSLDPCCAPGCTGTRCHLIVRSERGTFRVDLSRIFGGKNVPRNAGKVSADDNPSGMKSETRSRAKML